jgi:hypothetical protein
MNHSNCALSFAARPCSFKGRSKPRPHSSQAPKGASKRKRKERRSGNRSQMTGASLKVKIFNLNSRRTVSGGPNLDLKKGYYGGKHSLWPFVRSVCQFRREVRYIYVCLLSLKFGERRTCEKVSWQSYRPFEISYDSFRNCRPALKTTH